jgi:hypothetical protein
MVALLDCSDFPVLQKFFMSKFFTVDKSLNFGVFLTMVHAFTVLFRIRSEIVYRRLLAPKMIMDSKCSAHIYQMTSGFLREVQLIYAGNLVASLGWEVSTFSPFLKFPLSQFSH